MCQPWSPQWQGEIGEVTHFGLLRHRADPCREVLFPAVLHPVVFVATVLDHLEQHLVEIHQDVLVDAGGCRPRRGWRCLRSFHAVPPSFRRRMSEGRADPRSPGPALSGTPHAGLVVASPGLPPFPHPQEWERGWCVMHQPQGVSPGVAHGSSPRDHSEPIPTCRRSVILRVHRFQARRRHR